MTCAPRGGGWSGAQDHERQRIERNLHDGAQQQLVALIVLLSLLEDAAAEPEEVRQLAGQLRDGLRAALDDLRVAGPRHLSAAARRPRAARPRCRPRPTGLMMPVQLEAMRVGRLSREAEATVYFCVLEALAERREVCRRGATPCHAEPGPTASSRSRSPTTATGFNRGRRPDRLRAAGHGRPARRGRRQPRRHVRPRRHVGDRHRARAGHGPRTARLQTPTQSVAAGHGACCYAPDWEQVRRVVGAVIAPDRRGQPGRTVVALGQVGILTECPGETDLVNGETWL